MVTFKKIVDGLSAYIESDMVPQVSGYKKWIMIAASSLLLNNADGIYESLKDNALVKAMGIIDDNGHIDIDKVYASLRPAAMRCPATLDIPMVGTYTLDEDDIEAIYARIIS